MLLNYFLNTRTEKKNTHTKAKKEEIKREEVGWFIRSFSSEGRKEKNRIPKETIPLRFLLHRKEHPGEKKSSKIMKGRRLFLCQKICVTNVVVMKLTILFD